MSIPICSCPGCDASPLAGRRTGGELVPALCGSCELHGCTAEQDRCGYGPLSALPDRDAAVLQGFADCEALVITMARAQAAGLEAGTVPIPSTYEHAGVIASWALNSFALALSVGQHRTDQYDPDELRKVHARAGMPAWMHSAGGKALAASRTPQERSEATSKASKVRWKKARKE